MDPRERIKHLSDSIARGDRVSFLFFWGHTGNGKSVGEECLSQWYPAAFDIDGTSYRTAEHYMMAKKARLFGAEEIASRILDCEHPDQAKRLGREVPNFDPEIWERQRFGIVVEGNIQKFVQTPVLATFLVNTGNRILVEASPVDRIWGIGLSAENPNSTNPARWHGLNLLGFALMQVRSQLASGCH